MQNNEYKKLKVFGKGLFTDLVMQSIPTPLRGYSNEPIFYVYTHSRPDGSVFYVGKGKNQRAYSKKNRNPHWKHIVEKYSDYTICIVKSGLTEQESFVLEFELINQYGFDNLTNQTLGGISTTGMKHSRETRKLQSELAKQRTIENPEWFEGCNARIKKLNEQQRRDPNYYKNMSEKAKVKWSSLSEEEKQVINDAKCEWMLDPVKKTAAIEKLRISVNKPENKERLSKRIKEIWASKTPEERKLEGVRLGNILNSPEIREKLLLSISDKVVVNRKYVFKSKVEFLDSIKSQHAVLSKSQKTAKSSGYDFCVVLGYFVEEFDDTKHSHLPFWNGESISKLDFQCLPRSKAVVMDESVVFLSMNEASVFCKGKTIEATADFITKNMKRGKPAMGHTWRVATTSEIEAEILCRLDKL